jgi:ELWxxDGT repeat protein
MIKNINPAGDGTTAFMGKLGSNIYFWGNNGVDGQELWKSDGTEAGTVMIKDINPTGNGNAGYYVFVELNGYLYFHANDGVNGTELWKTDGTSDNTLMVKNINASGNSVSAFTPIEIMNGLLFFPANDGVNGVELWKSDGTEGGTVMVSNINASGNSTPMGYSSGSKRRAVLDGFLYFQANDGVNGSELWKTDGTEVNTTMVKNIHTTGNSSPYELVASSTHLFFNAQNNTDGKELWISDGTEAGTVMVKDILPGIGGSDPYYMVVMNENAYFSADNGTNGVELWKSDGTEAGTFMVKDIYATGGAWPEYTTVLGDNIYFSAYDNVNGGELWKSDGTEEGTTMVKDILPGSSGSWPQTAEGRYFVAGGKIYFQASDGVNGYELWVSDGTNSGTNMVLDIYPGASSSSPNYFISIGNTMFFKANNGTDGAELWKLETYIAPTPTPTSIPTPTPTTSQNLQLTYINGIMISPGVDKYYHHSNSNILFKGVTHPLANVKITVNSDPKVCETTSNSEGYFECNFPYIENGLHTVTVVATTTEGQVITYPQFTLGINVSLVPTGKPVYTILLVGFTFSIMILLINNFPNKKLSP